MTADVPDDGLPLDEDSQGLPNDEDLWGDDGVTLRGNIHVTSPIPVTIDGLTVYGNVTADKSADLELNDLWVKSGGDPMAGNINIKVDGEANVAENRASGDISIDVVGKLKAVRNQAGGSAPQVIEPLILICQEPATADRLAAIESALDDLKAVAAKLEKDEPVLARKLVQMLKSAAIAVGVNTATDAAQLGIAGLWHWITEQLSNSL